MKNNLLKDLSTPAGFEQGIRGEVQSMDEQGDMSSEIAPGASENAVLKQAEGFADLVLQAEREVGAGGPTPAVDLIVEQVMQHDRENNPVDGDVPTVIGGMAAALQIASPELRSMIMQRAGNPDTFMPLQEEGMQQGMQQTPLAGLAEPMPMAPPMEGGIDPSRPSMSKMDQVSPLRSLMK